MKQIITLYTDYSSSTNRELLDILNTLPGDDVIRDAGSYYGSILGIMNHMVAANVFWLKRFSDNFEELSYIRPMLPVFRLESLTDMAWEDLKLLADVLSSVDKLLVEAVSLLPEERFGETITYNDIRGNENNKIAWRALLHVCNHQTHHRGQVSMILDQMNVENDFSNLIWKY